MTAAHLFGAMVHEDDERGRCGSFKNSKRGFAALEAGPVGVEVPVAAVAVGERGLVLAGAVEVGEAVVEDLGVVG